MADVSGIHGSSIRVFLARASGAALTFAGIAIFARMLDASTLGSFFLFQAMLGISAIIADFGINPAVAKRISEGQPSGEILTTALFLKFIPVSLVSGVILVFSTRINAYAGAEVANYLVAGVALQELSRVMMRTLEGEIRVGDTALIRFVDRTFWVLAGGFLIWQGYGIEGLLIGLLAGKGLGFLIGVIRIDAQFARPRWEVAQSLYNFSKYNFFSNIGGYVYGWMDIVVIGLFIGQAAVATYEVAWRVTAVVVLFTNSIASAIFPQISEWNAKEATAQIESLIPEVVTPSLFFIIPAFAGTVILSEDILTYVFSPEYATASLVLVVLMADKVAQGIQAILGRSLLAIDRPDIAAAAAITSTVANLMLNVILVWHFGIIGAAVGTVIASLTNDLFHYWALVRHISVKILWDEIYWCSLAAVVMSIGLVVVIRVFPITSLGRLLAIVALGAIIYNVITLSSSSIRLKMLAYIPYR